MRNADRPLFQKDLILQKIQPALLGLMDGSVSTLAPIFAAASLGTTTFYTLHF